MTRSLFTFWFGNKKMAMERLKVAESLEFREQYKDACYSYALAMHLGIRDKICAQKVVYLWQTYGPFDYSNITKQLEEEKDFCGLSGHQATVGKIRNIVEGIKSDSS